MVTVLQILELFKRRDVTRIEQVNSLVCLARGEPIEDGRVQEARIVKPFCCCWCSAHVFSAVGQSLISRLLNENNRKYTPRQSASLGLTTYTIRRFVHGEMVRGFGGVIPWGR